MMEENKTRPTFVVLTPVRNEAWILRAFLEAASLWADHIIIADQMSTDGSREIAKEYPKVILVDNDRKEMHQAATRRLLFEEAKKIEGVPVVFDIRVLPKSMTDGYDAWWHVGIASSSEIPGVQEAYRRKEENLAKARKY